MDRHSRLERPASNGHACDCVSSHAGRPAACCLCGNRPLSLSIDLVPSVVRQAFEYGSLPDMDRLELPRDLKTRMLANLSGAVVQAIAAIWLLFHPDGLIIFIARVRGKIAPRPSV
jgi:hypothetical protein